MQGSGSLGRPAGAISVSGTAAEVRFGERNTPVTPFPQPKHHAPGTSIAHRAVEQHAADALSDINREPATPERDRAGPPRHAHLAYVVDDDPAALALMCEIAEDAGWSCRGFERLGDLHAGLDSQRPDLLILDDDLPDGSGGDLARALRDDPSTARMPVIVCTGAHPMRRAEITSWAPVVAKPFRIEELERFLDAARRSEGRTFRQRAAG
jgi:CheY-like chemotaxis protein